MNWKKYITRKRIIWAVIILVVLIGGWFIFKPKNNAANIQSDKVKKQDIQQTVLATGQVVSGTDLNLGFQSSGVVTKVNVKEGDHVVEGQVLATLNQASALASLTSARGSYTQAKANYDKVLAGARPEDVQTTQDTVTSANQDLLNQYVNARTTLNGAYDKAYADYSFVVTLQNTYFGAADQQGIKVTNAKNDMQKKTDHIKNTLNAAITNDALDSAIPSISNDLTDIYNDISVVRDQADIGVYYTKISSTDRDAIDTQKAAVNTVLTSVNGLSANIASYKVALQKAKDQLVFKQAPATQADLDAAKGQLLSAQGQVDAATATLNNLIIKAPTSGTITKVDIKVGQEATALSEAMVLENISDLHAEADISEANIASLNVEQPIDYTFDALGPDKHFTGKILTINPSSTVISGVVNYKVKGSLENVPGVKPGMTVNMTVLVAQKSGALVVPSSAIISKNDNQYVRVIDDTKKKTYHEVEITSGLQADGGVVEVLSGLSEGQEIVTYIKQ